MVEQHPFIFSGEWKFKIRRHLAFWIFWWMFMAFLYSFLPVVTNLGFGYRLLNSMCDSIIYLPTHIFLAYTLMYFVIPKYIVPAKYVWAGFWSVLLMMTTAMLAAMISIYVLIPVKTYIFPSNKIICIPPPKIIDFRVIGLSFMAGLRGALTIGGIAATIKLMKHFYFKEQLNLKLQKENVEARLQLLKSQVHPHFLFNTLNNIYSNTRKTAPLASEMICGLSDMLRYMLYECDKDLVPLEKELKMVEEYINLEKVRYGNDLDLHIDLPADTKGLFIAPLLLLPLIENCFKHGLSKMLEQPWLNLSIAIQNEEMTMKLLNSKQPGNSDHGHGIGLANVRKRLELLYPYRHQLQITEEDEVFIVHLKLKLVKEPIGQKSFSQIVPAEFALN